MSKVGFSASPGSPLAARIDLGPWTLDIGHKVPPPTARSGYTLLELLLVLAIIVIAAAAAAPSMRGRMRNAAVRSAANEVRAALTRRMSWR